MHCQGKVRKRIIYSLFLKGIKLTYDWRLRQCSQEQTLHASHSLHAEHAPKTAARLIPRHTIHASVCQIHIWFENCYDLQKAKKRNPKFRFLLWPDTSFSFLVCPEPPIYVFGITSGTRFTLQVQQPAQQLYPRLQISRQAFKMQFQDKAVKR